MRLSKITSVPLIEGTTRSLGISGCIAKSMTMNSQTGRLQQKHRHFAKVPQTSSANGAKATGWLPFFTTKKNSNFKEFPKKNMFAVFSLPKKKMEPKELACSRPSYKGRYKSLAIPTLGRHMPQLQSSSSRGMNIYLAEESRSSLLIQRPATCPFLRVLWSLKKTHTVHRLQWKSLGIKVHLHLFTCLRLFLIHLWR